MPKMIMSFELLFFGEHLTQAFAEITAFMNSHFNLERHIHRDHKDSSD